MINFRILFSIILLSLLLSSCFIELPPIDELPYIINNTESSNKGEYTYSDSVKSMLINISASYFYSKDSLTTYSTIKLVIKNISENKILFDTKSVKLESHNSEYLLMHSKPSKILLESKQENQLLYLFQSATLNERSTDTEIIILKLFIYQDQRRELISKYYLRII